MEDIKRKCNPIINLLKFTFNKKIFSGEFQLVQLIKLLIVE